MSRNTTPLTFGKYKGQSPDEIAEHDPGYVVWLYENIKPRVVGRDLALACERDVREEESELYGDEP